MATNRLILLINGQIDHPARRTTRLRELAPVWIDTNDLVLYGPREGLNLWMLRADYVCAPPTTDSTNRPNPVLLEYGAARILCCSNPVLLELCTGRTLYCCGHVPLNDRPSGRDERLSGEVHAGHGQSTKDCLSDPGQPDGSAPGCPTENGARKAPVRTA